MMPAASVVAANAGLVAALSGLVAGASWRAMIRSGNPRLTLVAAGFAVLAAKSAAKAWMLLADAKSLGIELAFSVMDVVAVGLVAWPVLAAARDAAEARA